MQDDNGFGNGGGPLDPEPSEEERMRSISDRADAGDHEDADADQEVFVWEQGRKVTLGTLYARNVPVEHAFVFSGRRQRGRGGLIALDEQPVLVLRAMPGPVRIVPTHDADGNVTKIVLEQTLMSQVVVPAESDEGVALVGPVVDAWREQQVAA